MTLPYALYIPDPDHPGKFKFARGADGRLVGLVAGQGCQCCGGGGGGDTCGCYSANVRECGCDGWDPPPPEHCCTCGSKFRFTFNFILDNRHENEYEIIEEYTEIHVVFTRSHVINDNGCLALDYVCELFNYRFTRTEDGKVVSDINLTSCEQFGGDIPYVGNANSIRCGEFAGFSCPENFYTCFGEFHESGIPDGGRCSIQPFRGRGGGTTATYSIDETSTGSWSCHAGAQDYAYRFRCNAPEFGEFTIDDYVRHADFRFDVLEPCVGDDPCAGGFAEFRLPTASDLLSQSL